MIVQNKTFYQKTSINRIMIWTIAQQGSTLSYNWGYMEGAQQDESEEVQATSRTTAEQQAALVFDRKCCARIRDGYYLTEEEAESNSSATFSFDPLPTSFAPPKPISKKPCEPDDIEQPNKKIRDLITQKRLLAQRKANGIRGWYIRFPKGEDGEKDLFSGVKADERIGALYSRKVKDMSANFPEIVKLFNGLPIPNGSMIDMEVTLGGGYTVEQFRTVSAMSPNCLPGKASEIYSKWLEKHENQPLCAECFDAIFWDGECVLRKEYQERYTILQRLVANNHCRMLAMIDILENMEFDEAVKRMRKEDWEGLVLWDKEMRSDFWLNGKPKRLVGCWKWKNTVEEDVFIIECVPEKGNKDLVGSFEIGQFDSEGRVIHCGKVGSGELKDEQKTEAWDWVGKVIIIKYESRYEPNSKGEICFQHGRFHSLHPDKTKDECIIEI